MKGNSSGSGLQCSAGQKRGMVIMGDWVMLLLPQKKMNLEKITNQLFGIFPWQFMSPISLVKKG